MPYRVTASIRPSQLDNVLEALADVGLHEFTVSPAQGFTHQPQQRIYRGVTYYALEERVLVDVIVPEGVAAMVGELLAANARTDAGGDGTVWLTSLERAIDVRSGDHDTL